MNPDAGLRIGPGEVGDARAVLALQRRVLEEGGSFATAPDEFRLTEERMKGVLSELIGGGIFLVARDDRGVLGALLVHRERIRALRHVGRLELFVHPDARRRGVGDALLAEAVRRAEADPVLRKLSLAVFADNAPALALYRKHGFREEGRRLGEYLLDDGTPRDDLLLWRAVPGPATEVRRRARATPRGR